MEDKIMCPLVDRDIDIVDCMENRDLDEKFILPEYKQKENWREICASCKYCKY